MCNALYVLYFYEFSTMELYCHARLVKRFHLAEVKAIITVCLALC